MAENYDVVIIGAGAAGMMCAIEAGKPFARMVHNGLRSVEMDDIRRQSDARHIAAIKDVIAQDIGAAIQKLAPETREIPDRDDRLSAMLSDWQSAGDGREKILMLATKNNTRTELNDRARQILRAESKLQGEKPAQQLKPIYTQRADTALASTYKEGQVVHFPRQIPSIGIERGAYVRVIKVDRTEKQVFLDVAGAVVQWRPDMIAGGSKTPPQLYEPRMTTLAANERITWSKNNPELGLTNGQRLTVIATSEKAMTVQTEDGQRVDIDRTKPQNQHWEHGYATTIYKSQGKTADRVLVDANSDDKALLSQKAFLVAVSRQKDGLTIYTDSIEKLTSSVQSNPGEKESAIKARQAVVAPSARDELEKRYQQVSEKAQVQWPRAPRKFRTPGLDFER